MMSTSFCLCTGTTVVDVILVIVVVPANVLQSIFWCGVYDTLVGRFFESLVPVVHWNSLASLLRNSEGWTKKEN